VTVEQPVCLTEVTRSLWPASPDAPVTGKHGGERPIADLRAPISSTEPPLLPGHRNGVPLLPFAPTAEGRERTVATWPGAAIRDRFLTCPIADISPVN